MVGRGLPEEGDLRCVENMVVSGDAKNYLILFYHILPNVLLGVLGMPGRLKK